MFIIFLLIAVLLYYLKSIQNNISIIIEIFGMEQKQASLS